jgi:hypothetical protein
LADVNLSETQSAQEASIDAWLAEATPASAERLDALARSTGSKEIRKAARRALYSLSQRGIKPQAASSNHAPRSAADRRETMRAWASAFDGAGNRLILLLLAGADGGHPTVAQILANDELGIRNLTIERKPAREITPLMEKLEGRIDEGLVIAEIEPDYARTVIEQFRSINFRRSTTTPAGFVDLLPRIGTPGEVIESSPVYARFSAEDLEKSADFPRDPADLFKLPWFEPWFFAVEDVVPWLHRWMDADNSTVVTTEKAKQERKSNIAREVASALISANMRALYAARLEESADVLRRRNRDREARMALFHATALKSDVPIGEVPFAVSVAARTLDAAAEMVAEAEAEKPGN